MLLAARARAPRRRAGHAAAGLDLRPLPGAEEVLALPGRQAVGRAEADAGGGRAICRAARADPDRRAEQGPGAVDHPEPDRRLRELKRAEDDHPAGRAELHDGQGKLGDSVAVMDNGRVVHSGAMARTGRRRGPAAAPARPVAGSAPMSAATTARPPAAAPCRRRTSTGSRWPAGAGARLLALPLVGSPDLADADRRRPGDGLIIFIIASGLTLVFGLMDVLNFGHGVFIALGAFVATSVMGGMAAGPGDSWLGATWPASSPRWRWRWRSPARSAGPSSASSCARSTACT
jgi:hypothetical protein